MVVVLVDEVSVVVVEEVVVLDVVASSVTIDVLEEGEVDEVSSSSYDTSPS